MSVGKKSKIFFFYFFFMEGGGGGEGVYFVFEHSLVIVLGCPIA